MKSLDTILIIDDEADIVESLEVMLSKGGYAVLSAGSAQEGIKKANEQKPDLIIMDVMMPEMSGIEACNQIKKSPVTQNIPVLLLTASNDSNDVVRGLDAGADDYIGKPFKDGELRARVRAFLRSKKLRDELEESYRKLKEMEKLRDSLAHMIVHDLKAPLTSVGSGIAILLEQIEQNSHLDNDQIKLLKKAHVGANRLLDLIQDILDVSRLEDNKLPVEKKKGDLIQLLNSCLSMVEALSLQSGVQLSIRVDGELPMVDMDENLIRRVVLNLLTNSFKFTPEGGSISVESRFDSREKRVEVAIVDTGLGIPNEFRERIFDKFFQIDSLKTSRRGQGLGLAFCRMVINSHGGNIWAESQQEKGSRFVFRLPV